MDDLLWLLIGLGGGVLVAVALAGTSTASRQVKASRRLAVIATGGVAAVIASRALVLWMPLTRTDGLTRSAAALAGALWMSTIVGFTLLRRRRSVESGAAAMPGDTYVARPMRTGMPAYDAARQAMVDGLMADATAHDAGQFHDIGQRFAAVHSAIPDDTAQTTKLHTALRFWRSWMQARDARWPVLDVPGGIGITEWPQLARKIASDLALDRELSSSRVRDRFETRVQPSQSSSNHQRPTTSATGSHT